MSLNFKVSFDLSDFEDDDFYKNLEMYINLLLGLPTLPPTSPGFPL